MQNVNSHFETQTQQRENSSQTVTTRSLFPVYDLFQTYYLRIGPPADSVLLWPIALWQCQLTILIPSSLHLHISNTMPLTWSIGVAKNPDKIEINLMTEMKVISLQLPPIPLDIRQPPQNHRPFVQNISSEWRPLFENTIRPLLGNTSEQWFSHWFCFIFVDSNSSTNIP